MSQIQVLVVDDDYASRLLITKILEKDNYRTSTCTNGLEGLDQLKKHSYDLLISDLKMEGMDGMQLLQKARSLDPNIAVIILTGYASMQTAIDSLRLGAVDYLMKPINIEELKIRVKKAIERINLERRIKEIERQMTYNATVTTANHEINQPLTVILSGIDMIKMEFEKKGITDPQLLKYLILIEKSSTRIANILRNLREITSPVIQKIPLGMQLVELANKNQSKRAFEKYILVIEDEEQIRILVKDMLEEAGYKVILSSNAEEGIQIYQSQMQFIELVVLDYFLPDSVGLDVVKKIKQFDPHCKILITSGFELDQEIQKVIESGAIGFLSKPFNREQILQYIQNISS
jgi:DNA-binding NtrC family response regulator